MPYALIEGFEDEGTQAHLAFSAADTGLAEVAGVRGLALQVTGNPSVKYHDEGVTGYGSVLTMCFGARVRVSTGNAGGSASLFRAKWTSNRWAELQLRYDGELSVNGNNVTDPAPGLSHTLPFDQWTYVEWKVTYNSGASKVDWYVYVDGVLIDSGVGDATAFGSESWAGGFITGTFGVTTDIGTCVMSYDDVYIWVDTTADTAPPTVNGASFPFGARGGVHVDRILPDATGALTDWGGAYTDVDDDDPTTSTGTSITSTTSTDQTSYSLATLPSSVASVLAVVYDVWAQGSGVLDPLWRSSGGSIGTDTTNVLGVPAAWGGTRAIVEDNPQTATDWTVSDVNTGEFGVELE